MSESTLRRTVGIPGAVVLGLGSILGTGVFVGLGITAGVAGDGLLLAVALAAVLATCNGLSSAALAAAHPVAGGTYAYGRRYLTPAAGFLAGWMFLCAKSASAATAALAVGAAAMGRFGNAPSGTAAAVGALLVTTLVTMLVASGLRRSNVVNTGLVAVSVVGLVSFAVFVGRSAPAEASALTLAPSRFGLLQGVALAFVAFTGYGRVATLGEEIRDPARTIPVAVALTLVVTAALYLGVAWAALHMAGAGGFAMASQAGVPLADLARHAGYAGLGAGLEMAGVLAMLGVLLNLVLGLSRIAFAMGRDGELAAPLGRLDARREPTIAVWAVGAAICALALLGDVRATWSLSAVTVLVYYGITNAAALRLPDRGVFARSASWLGLLGCLGLAPLLDVRSVLGALGLAALGFLLRGRFGKSPG